MPMHNLKDHEMFDFASSAQAIAFARNWVRLEITAMSRMSSIQEADSRATNVTPVSLMDDVMVHVFFLHSSLHIVG